MRKYLYILILLFLIPIPIYATTYNSYDSYDSYNPINKNDYYTDVTLDKKLYDYADLYSESEEEKLEEKIRKIIKKYNTEVVVMTTDFNGTYDTRSVAIEFYDGNGFGADSEGTGTILVIDMYARNYYILTTGKNLKIINDFRVESILDKMEGNMISGNYFQATDSFLDEVNKYESYHKYGPPFLWIGALIIAGILSFFSLMKERKKLKMIKDDLDASNYFIDNIVDEQEDVLTDTKTRHIYHSSSSSSGGGRSGGFSSGGGGRSHGGGGRRF